MDPVAVLFNPSSGRGKSLEKKSKLETVLKQSAVPFKWFSSRSEQHLRELARSISLDFSTLVIGGGDTSFRIVAAEILASGSDPVLAFVGTGSGNDITRSLGNDKIESLGGKLRHRKTRRMDVGKLEISGRKEAIFLGHLSLGLGVEVNRFVAEFWQRHPRLAKGGSFTQSLAGISGISEAFKNRTVPFRVNLKSVVRDGQCEFSLLVFSNIPFYAGGIKLAPGIMPFNGRLDCCIIKSSGFWSTLRIGLQAVRGRHLNRKEVEVISGDAFEIYSETQVDLQIDGDVLSGGKQINIRVLPAALTVLV